MRFYVPFWLFYIVESLGLLGHSIALHFKPKFAAQKGEPALKAGIWGSPLRGEF